MPCGLLNVDMDEMQVPVGAAANKARKDNVRGHKREGGRSTAADRLSNRPSDSIEHKKEMASR